MDGFIDILPMLKNPQLLSGIHLKINNHVSIYAKFPYFAFTRSFNKSKQKRIIFKQCSEAREISTMWISELWTN